MPRFVRGRVRSCAHLGILVCLGVTWACNDDDPTPATTSTSASVGTGGAGAQGGEGQGGQGGQGGRAEPGCMVNATGPTRGDAIALSPDGGTAVVVNRDAGSVTVFDAPALQERAEIALGGEPWQVVIDGCGERAYVVLRESQKLVELVEDRKSVV